MILFIFSQCEKKTSSQKLRKYRIAIPVGESVVTSGVVAVVVVAVLVVVKSLDVVRG